MTDVILIAEMCGLLVGCGLMAWIWIRLARRQPDRDDADLLRDWHREERQRHLARLQEDHDARQTSPPPVPDERPRLAAATRAGSRVSGVRDVSAGVARMDRAASDAPRAVQTSLSTRAAKGLTKGKA